MAKELAKYEVDGQEICITDVDVVRVFCDNENVTQREVKMFVELCKAHKLNPFIKEAYLVKYGTNPAALVVGKDVFTKRAQRNPRFKGMQAGIFVLTRDGKGKEREGSMVLPGETVLGGWCKVHVEGYDVPIYDSVSFDEYANKRKDGKLAGSWAKMPGTMIRKVAMVHALREAFPDDLQGMYDAAEMGVEPQQAAPEPVEAAPVDAEPAEVVAAAPEAVVQPAVDAKPAPRTAYEQLQDAVAAYCAATGADPQAEMDNLLVRDDTPESWMLATAANYRAAAGQAA